MALKAPVVVRQIGSRPLYIGSSRAAHEGATDISFQHVVSLGPIEHPLTTHHIAIKDGRGLKPERFREAVGTAVELYKSGGALLIHCQVGISRSPAVAAAVIALDEEISFEEALLEVKQERQRASPQRELRECAQELVQENVLIHS